MTLLRLLAFALVFFCFSTVHQAQELAEEIEFQDVKADVPLPLRPWIEWVKKDALPNEVPRLHSDASVRLPLWASRLALKASSSEGRFTLHVEAFDSVSLALPGGGRIWPTAVTVDGQVTPVIDRDGNPFIHLASGAHTVAGQFRWPELPQQIKIPPAIGLLGLEVNGEAQLNPSWKPDGTLWLQRQASSDPVDEDFLSVRAHSLLEDGIPLWFETKIELIVAGTSREEALGTVLPEGWSLASIDSPIPVAIDENGLLKAQLRAGRWSITLRTFQNGNASQIAFAEGASPAVPDQSLSFRTRPDFRQAEITGLPQIDVAQTQVPAAWRDLPVYRWDTGKPVSIEERVRGVGERGIAPLKITRALWLDDGGKLLTYQDQITGNPRKIRRIDAAEGNLLGSVSIDGEPQLITHNPDGGAPGFEVRSPQLTATATGQIKMGGALSATGWQSDAESLSASLELPPGYRLFSISGADYSKGDWLTSWTLLDLFLLLLFTLAVFRLCGLRGALVAFFAFGLAYHEPGAPRFPWLLLLAPVAIAAFMPEGRFRKIVVGFKWGFAVLLLLSLLPFAAKQIQGAVFPQLERSAAFSEKSSRSIVSSAASYSRGGTLSEKEPSNYKKKKANLKADPRTVIQTGPGVPAWKWRTITFGWEGPVSASQEVRALLIPPYLSRILAVVRTLGLFGLLIVLLSFRRKSDKTADPTPGASTKLAPTATAIILLPLLLLPRPAAAQFPDQTLLNELRDHVTQSDKIAHAFPGAAHIPEVNLRLAENRLTLQVSYHAAARCAAPVPFPLKAATLGSATFAEGGSAHLIRRDGQLWVLLPSEGIFQLTLNARLRDVSDWEWGFPLKPKHITIDAEGWSVSGIRADGTAEDQVLFAPASRDAANTTANYDRPDTRPALLVKRTLELGLVWRVTTKVTRLSPKGRAVVLKIPVLPGEKVVSSGRSIEGGQIEIRLAPDADSLSWEGELAPLDQLTLTTQESADWSEQWRLIASSVWNVTFSGLPPSFVAQEGQLVPLWQPWPGETTTLHISRPTAVAGEIVTIDSVTHTLDPGRRQRTSSLALSLRTSLGEDFPITLPKEAEIISLTHAGKNIPIRKEGQNIIVPLKPGQQTIDLKWRHAHSPSGWTRSDPITLPVGAANVTTRINPSSGRWLILTDGPLHGPAVRFWGILAFILIVAIILARVPGTPIRLHEWILLSLGLTQIPLPIALFVVAWLFMIRWRGTDHFQSLTPAKYNFSQATLLFLTLISIGIFIWIASTGLLGSPEMYIAGNYSSASSLKWFSARTDLALPQPGYWSLSIWWFRLAMLFWALWLSAALVRWIRLGWKNFSKGGYLQKTAVPKKKPKANTKETTPPPIPKK